MRKRIIIIGSIISVSALLLGLSLGVRGTNFATAMQDALTRAEEAQEEARMYSCKRVISLYANCVASDGGLICNALHSAEDEHRFYFEEEDPIDACRVEPDQPREGSAIPDMTDTSNPLFYGDEAGN